MVNNLRVSVNRTRVLRTHADMFGPEDVGVKTYSYLPDYMNITITGAFAINTATETFSFYKPNTYGVSDDLTIVRGRPSVRDRRRVVAVELEDGIERPRRWARSRSTAA